jgi:tRNA(Ile2) C34 agmatinyltransferase TiaS
VSALTLPGLEPVPARERRRGERPASAPAGDRPELLARLLGERDAAGPAAQGPAGARGPGSAPVTLDELLSDAWAGLAAEHAVACPCCGGRMAPRPSAGGAPAGGRCGDCGTTLG